MPARLWCWSVELNIADLSEKLDAEPAEQNSFQNKQNVWFLSEVNAESYCIWFI